jgi:putative peptidoglycan lipid II flippase
MTQGPEQTPSTPSATPTPQPPSHAPAAPNPTPSHHGLSSAVRTVGGVTLLSRFGGMARDVLVINLFGATALGSAFAAGFAIPNMFRRLFGEGALSAAFIPEYTSLTKDDPALADRLASLTVATLLLATTALTVAIELALLLVLIFAPGDETRRMSIQLVMVMLPFMPLICVAAILGGILQVHGKFGPAASGPLLLNGFIIVVAAFHMLTGRAGDLSAATAIGVATVVSGVSQCLWFNKLLKGHVRWTRVFTGVNETGRRMLKKFVPVLIGLGTLQINSFLDTLIAMWPNWVGPTILGRAYPLDQASNVLLSAAQRPYQFPLGVFGIAVATAIFPMLARQSRDHAAFESTLKRGMRLSFFIGLPASIGLMLVASDLIGAFYSWSGENKFTPDDVSRAASALHAFAAGIWAYSLNHVLTRAFYAKGDTRTPMRISLAMCALNLTLNLILIWPLREAGLAWSTTIAAAVQTLVLSFYLGRGAGVRSMDADVLRAFARIAIATAIMALGVWLLLELLPDPTRHLILAIRVLAATAAGAGLFLVSSRLLGAPELPWLLERRRVSPHAKSDAVESAMD